MFAYLQKFHAAKDSVGDIEHRPDIVALQQLVDANSPHLSRLLVVAELTLAHGVREPEYVASFNGNLMKSQDRFNPNDDQANVMVILDCFDPLKYLKVKPHCLPKRLAYTHGSPANIMANFNVVNLLAFANLVTQRLAGDLTSDDRRLIVREMKRFFHGVGTYWAEHFFRTLTIVFNRPFPGSSFVVMGSGADKAAYDRLRAFGVHNMDELNTYLLQPLDAGRFAYYVCMGKL